MKCGIVLVAVVVVLEGVINTFLLHLLLLSAPSSVFFSFLFSFYYYYISDLATSVCPCVKKRLLFIVFM